MSSPASLHALLSHKAYHHASFRGQDSCSAALKHKAEALRLVNEDIARGADAIGDETILAVLVLTGLEVSDALGWS